jgi:hypothetical protein
VRGTERTVRTIVVVGISAGIATGTVRITMISTRITVMRVTCTAPTGTTAASVTVVTRTIPAIIAGTIPAIVITPGRIPCGIVIR